MFGLERTLEHAARAVACGYEVIPRLVARQVKDERELIEFAARLDELGIHTLYVICGDGAGIGDINEASEILEALTRRSNRSRRCLPAPMDSRADRASPPRAGQSVLRSIAPNTFPNNGCRRGLRPRQQVLACGVEFHAATFCWHTVEAPAVVRIGIGPLRLRYLTL